MAVLRLELTDFTGPARWRWRLTDSGGTVLAEHQVRLDTGSPWYEALGDLDGFLRAHAIPDAQRLADEARIVRTFGRWVGTEVFGPVGAALAARPPGTVVEVVLPTPASVIASYPLECALVGAGLPGGEETLARRRIGLVLSVGDRPSGLLAEAAADGDRLRVLGLFSAPAGAGALNLRREREGLRALVDLAKRDRAVDLRILQYGVTRQRLQEIVASGWDIVHVSGHGMPGALLLELPDGTQDPVTGDELVGLLAPAAGHLKLVTVSTCSSAALPGGQTASALAVTLAGRLDCAVLAMRFPVVEDFAAALTAAVYERLITTRCTLPEALGAVLAPLVPVTPTRRCPALSLVTPAVFGGRALETFFQAPPRDGSADDARPTGGTPLGRPALGELPPPRPRFAGRVEVLARAGAALAPESGVSTVVLQGMAGVGTTSCALELAHTHRDAFRSVVWYSVSRDLPTGDAGARTTLTEFTAALADSALARNRMLVVIDNADVLLTADGRWAGQWDAMLASLTSHAGPGRLLITTRRPVPIPRERQLVQLVHALAADEALLLAAELPNLGALLDSGPEREPTLLQRVLDQARGHPGLLELADGQATEQARLAAWLRRLPGAAGQDYAAALDSWTAASVSALAEEERVFVFFLCALEEVDRDYMLTPMLMVGWPRIRQFADVTGDPTDPRAILDVLAAHALVWVDILPPHEGVSPGLVRGARIHPGVRAAIRRLAPPGFQDAVDTVAAQIWTGFAERTLRGGESSRQVTVAARSALPYLVRLGDWDQVGQCVLQVVSRDSAAATIGALLPTAEQLVRATAGTGAHLESRRVLARLNYELDPERGLADCRALLDDATAAGREDIAHLVADDLINAYRAVGRLTDAQRMAELGSQAGVGPWTRLGDERQRLRLLDLAGEHGEALIEADRLLREADSLPDASAARETVAPWQVRELLLNTAGSAASHLRQWDLALEYLERLAGLQRARGAYARDLAITRFNSVGVLRGLGRTGDALAVLRECREVFEADDDTETLGMLLSQLSDIEEQHGQHAAALATRRGVLRIAYRFGDPLGIASAHDSYARALADRPEQIAEKAAHHLADAVIRAVVGSGELWGPLLALASLPDRTGLPGSIEALASITDRIDGVRLGELLQRLEPDPRERARKFAAFGASARRRATEATPESTRVIPLLGTDAQEPDDVLAGRAAGALRALPGNARLFFRFLCALESADRSGPFFDWTLAANWPDVWRRAGRGGEPPEPHELLAAVARPELATLVAHEDGAIGAVAIQPPVARLVRDPDFQRMVDEELAVYWSAVPEAVRQRGGGQDTSIVLLAARSALPYQVRLADWVAARETMQVIVTSDPSPESAEEVLPAARELVAATAGTQDGLPARHNLARIARVHNAAGGLVLCRRVLNDAVAAGNWRLASVAAEDVLVACQATSRLADALDVVTKMAEYSRRAGYGPWTQLNDERARLDILLHVGRGSEAHAEITGLLARAESLPAAYDDSEAVTPGQVREQLLDTAADAAAATGAWPDALRYLERELAALQERGAPGRVIAEVRFKQWVPLRALGRISAARAVVVECRDAFAAAADLRMGLAAEQALAELDRDS